MLGFAALCFVVLTRHHWQQICDDAFIAFRYANHVAAGLGPVWNGGEPVEGYSSPLWLGILVVGRLAGAALPTFAGVVGVAGSATCIVLAQRFALTLTQSRVSAAARGHRHAEGTIKLQAPKVTSAVNHVVSRPAGAQK